MKRFILLLALGLCACGAPHKTKIDTTLGLSSIQRDGLLVKGGMESTPVCFNNEIINVISIRDIGSSRAKAIEFRLDDGTLINTYYTTYGFISALVDQNTLYVFMTADWSRQNSIEMISTQDLVHWTSPYTVKTSGPGQVFFNTSVAKDDTGFIMAYEVCEPNMVCFSSRFAHSSDLLNWSDVGAILHADIYAACPTIRYYNGYYYIVWLKNSGDNFFSSFVSRSQDLVSFEDSSIPFITPYLQSDEGQNASDVDFVEVNGVTYINYAVGMQTGEWSNIKRAHFNGSEKRMLESFF